MIYDYILWVGPVIHRFPRDRKFTIGNRILDSWYDLLDMIIEAKYVSKESKAVLLKRANIKLEKIRFMQRLLLDDKIWEVKRYKYAAAQVDEIGKKIGGWIKKI